MKKTLFLLTVMVLCLLTACGSRTADPAATHGSVAVEVTPEPMMQIETDYGSISYPAEWKDVLKVDETLQENGVTLTLSTEVEGTKYELFKVSLGEGPGEQQGTVTAPDGTEQPVFIEIHDLPDLSALSPEEQDRLYGMQEGVNDVISALNH